jgi:hypothetical protein
MAQVIPLLPTPSQTLSVRLGVQSCRLHVYQKTTGLYVDLYVGDTLVIGGVVARDGVRIVRDAYLGFVGDLAFADTQGNDDPTYTGLGSRWVLAYVA